MTNVVNEIATKLFQANKTKRPVEFIRHEYTVDEATSYAVQEALINRIREQEKVQIAGYKISMTSAETQAIANTHEPAYGTLLTNNMVKSGETIALSSLFEPLIEPEIMFILKEDLTPEASEEEIIAKVELAAGIEIPDARYIDWFPNFSLADLLCDNTATGLVVVAEPIQTALTGEQLGDINMELFHNAEKISEGHSSAVLDNPVKAVAWLSKKLAAKNKTLKQGMVISSGTFISPLRAEQGTYKVSYSVLGDVEITFN